jgi:hypothetical protein
LEGAESAAGEADQRQHLLGGPPRTSAGIFIDRARGRRPSEIEPIECAGPIDVIGAPFE